MLPRNTNGNFNCLAPQEGATSQDIWEFIFDRIEWSQPSSIAQEIFMKAIRVHRFGNPQVMKLEEVPDPELAEEQVIVRIHSAGVNPVDTYIRSGNYSIKPQLPYTPGADGAGEVVSAGEKAVGFKTGDRVYMGRLGTNLDGTYAEMVAVPVQFVHLLPARLSYSQGAGVYGPYSTAYQAWHVIGRAQAGEVILVHGASGGVGTAAVQLALSRQMTVIGTAGSEKGIHHLREQGVQHILNHHAADSVENVLELTEGRGVDLILEMLANVNLRRDLKMLALHGRVIVIGS